MNSNQQKTDSGWRVLDHTADLMLEVQGASLAELFRNAAQGMTAVLIPCADITTETEFDLVLEADAAEELLVSWLREILFYSQTRGLILASAEIDDLSETGLKATVYFGRSSPACEPEFEIKGVTYHGLSIEKKNEIYSARIVFDI